MANSWVDRQLALFRFGFDEADKDKSGNLSLQEVCNILRARGFCGTDAQAQAIFKSLDLDGNKSVSKAEFDATIKRLPKMTIQEFCLRLIFKGLDKDNTGFLTPNEIIAATKKEFEGPDVSNMALFDLLSALRTDSDEKLNIEEFLAAFRIKSVSDILKGIFQTMDTDKSGYLSKQEVVAAVKGNPELSVCTDQLDAMIVHLQTDADGKISYQEFLQIWDGQKGK